MLWHVSTSHSHGVATIILIKKSVCSGGHRVSEATRNFSYTQPVTALMQSARAAKIWRPPVSCTLGPPVICVLHELASQPVSVAQWANALSEPQCAARPDWLETCDNPGSIPRRGVGFFVSWTNSGHAMRLISRKAQRVRLCPEL